MTAEPKTAILDTNVLLLWLVGRTDSSLFATYKRVATFTVDDFGLLNQFLTSFQYFITTPHVLAEVSNFVDQAPQYKRRELMGALLNFAKSTEEHYETAIKLVERAEFMALGLSDTGLAALSSRALVLTTDFRLAGYIAARGGHAINFNHLRSAKYIAFDN